MTENDKEQVHVVERCRTSNTIMIQTLALNEEQGPDAFHVIILVLYESYIS